MKVLEYVCFLLGKTLLSVSEKDGLQKERECAAWAEHSLFLYCLISTSSFMSISSP